MRSSSPIVRNSPTRYLSPLSPRPWSGQILRPLVHVRIVELADLGRGEGVQLVNPAPGQEIDLVVHLLIGRQHHLHLLVLVLGQRLHYVAQLLPERGASRRVVALVQNGDAAVLQVVDEAAVLQLRGVFAPGCRLGIVRAGGWRERSVLHRAPVRHVHSRARLGDVPAYGRPLPHNVKRYRGHHQHAGQTGGPDPQPALPLGGRFDLPASFGLPLPALLQPLLSNLVAVDPGRARAAASGGLAGQCRLLMLALAVPRLRSLVPSSHVSGPHSTLHSSPIAAGCSAGSSGGPSTYTADHG